MRPLIHRLKRRWYLFAVCLPLFLVLAMVFVKVVTPKYKAFTKILVNESKQIDNLGGTNDMPNGIRLLDPTTNLRNEIGVLNSYDLVKTALESLDFGISYYTIKGLETRERYPHFPIHVVLDSSEFQVINVPFNIEILSDKEFQITAEADGFSVYKPSTGETRTIENKLKIDQKGEFGQTFHHELFSFEVLRSDGVISSLEFEGSDLMFKIHSIDGLVRSYLASLAVEAIEEKASIVNVDLGGTVPLKMTQFLTAYNEAYIMIKQEEKNQIASRTIEYIEQQLSTVSDSLGIAENQMEIFRREERAVDLNFTASNALTQLQTLETEKASLEINNKYYSNLLTYLQDDANLDQIVAPSAIGITNSTINPLILELKQQHAERIQATSLFSDQSRRLQTLDRQIEATKKAIIDNVRSIISNSAIALEDVNSRIGRFNYTITRLPRNERRQAELQRKFTLYDGLFRYLQQKRQSLEIARAENIPDVSILEAPRLSGSGPVFPKKSLILALAVLLGLLIPSLLAMFWDSMDDTLVDIEQVENKAGIPLLTPLIHTKAYNDNILDDSPEWEISESFWDLSVKLSLIKKELPCKMIGITSTISGEGKSFCAKNLAWMLGKSGKKTALIDFDLRKPQLIKLVDEYNGYDLVGYLKGEVDHASYLMHKTKLENLDLVLSEPLDPVFDNMYEIISSSKFSDLLEYMQYNYEYVIVDSPPVGMVSDYLFIAKEMDLTLFVLRSRYSKAGFMQKLEQLIRGSMLGDVYILFNDVRKSEFNYGYGKYKYEYPYEEDYSMKPTKKNFLSTFKVK